MIQRRESETDQPRNKSVTGPGPGERRSWARTRVSFGLLLGLLGGGLLAAAEDPWFALAPLRPGDGAAVLQEADRALALVDSGTGERQLLAALASPGVTDHGFQAICLRLVRVATPASVPVLTPWLEVPSRTHAARLVLTMVPGPEATGALLAALPRTAAGSRLGIIHSLGRRGDPKAVPVLGAMLAGADADPGLGIAVVRALGAIGDGTASALLESCAPSPAVDEALLMAVDCRRAAGDAATARRLLQVLVRTRPPGLTRQQALAGLVEDAGAAEAATLVPMLLDELAQGQARNLGGAVRGLERAPGAVATRAIADRLPSLPEDQRIVACGILARRGDPVGAPALIPFLEGGPALRRAAVEALAAIGGTAQAEALLGTAPDKRIRDALAVMVPRADIDRLLLARLSGSADAQRTFLLEVLALRQCSTVLPNLLADLADPDPRRGAEALPVLRRLAGSAELPALLDRLARRPGDQDLLGTIDGVIRRLARPDEVATLLEARWQGADQGLRQALLGLFAAAGRGEIRIRQALAAPGLRAAAIAAAADWPGAALAVDLAATAAGSEDPAQRTLALRGLVTVLDRSDHPSAATCAGLLDQALGQNSRDEDRRLVLSALPRHADEAAVALALRLARDPDVQKEAGMAILALARTLAPARSTAVREALGHLAAGEDPELHQEAVRLLQEADQPSAGKPQPPGIPAGDQP